MIQKCAHCGIESTRKYCSDRCKNTVRYAVVKADPIKYRAYLDRVRAAQKRRALRAPVKRTPPKMATCKCGQAFERTHGRQIYCSPACRKPSHRKVEMNCDLCGRACMKLPSSGTRYARVYCSTACRDKGSRRIDGDTCELPAQHWGRWFGRTSEVQFHLNVCTECECSYPTRWQTSAYCSGTCKNRSKDRKRRGREFNAQGDFNHASVVRLWRVFNQCCAYCRTTLALADMQAEHVVPLSRGGDNAITNILPSCGPCNSSKRSLLLHEWAADRKERNQTTVITTWGDGDPLYVHLAVPSAFRSAA